MNEISTKPFFLKCITPACPIVMRSHGTLYLLILTADSWSNNCCQKGSQVYSDGVMVCEKQSKILSNFCIDCGQKKKKTKTLRVENRQGLTDAYLFYVSVLHSNGMQCDIHAIDCVSGGTYERVSSLMICI